MLINFHDASIDLDSSSIGFIYRSDKLKQRLQLFIDSF